MNATEIKNYVLTQLEQRSGDIGGRYKFIVVDEAVYKDDEHLWHVLVRPDRPVERRGQFYDVLNDIEQELETHEHVNVMIVPVKPETNSALTGA